MDYQLWVDYHLLWCAFHCPPLQASVKFYCFPENKFHCLRRNPMCDWKRLCGVLCILIWTYVEVKEYREERALLGGGAAPVFHPMNVQQNNCQVFSFFMFLKGTRGSRHIWSRQDATCFHRRITYSNAGLLMHFPLTPDEPRHCQFLALRSAAVCTTWLKHFFLVIPV